MSRSVGRQPHLPPEYQIILREPDVRVASGEVRATARLGPWARGLMSARCGPCSARAFPTGPDAAAAHADREENHDPEGDKEEVDEGGAIRERPAGYKGVFGRFDRAGSGASVCPACRCSHHHGCWPVWRSRIGSRPVLRARSAWSFHWFSRPRLLTVAPYLSTDLPCVPDASSFDGHTVAAGAL